MRTPIAAVLEIVALLMTSAGCGHYPAPIRSVRDVKHTSSSEYMVVVVNLPLTDWPKLQKFTGLEHFEVAKELAPDITDAHVKALSRLVLPKLRQVSFAHCQAITDDGIEDLTRLPTIQGLGLNGTSVTDRGMLTLATNFPNLHSVDVESCSLVTERGFLGLTNSSTITDVLLSRVPFTQGEIENIISAFSIVTWWTISDPAHRIDEQRLREIGLRRHITIQVADENRYVRTITRAHGGAANRGQPIGSETNRTSAAAGPGG